ncbi:MAG: sulfur oxidation c-type cytochrome SoxX [Methyloprofundus sp.]|nr:sulfur oxidation c-type cytochrome SoxX [Methyloprofundus sp.]
MKTLLIFCLVLSLGGCTLTAKQQRLATGKQLSFQRDKGNCLACHIIEEGEDPGNIGPALVDIQAKFNSKAQLKAVIWDASQFNAQTSMPPFGKNKILTPEELDQVVDYIWSLTE